MVEEWDFECIYSHSLEWEEACFESVLLCKACPSNVETHYCFFMSLGVAEAAAATRMTVVPEGSFGIDCSVFASERLRFLSHIYTLSR